MNFRKIKHKIAVSCNGNLQKYFNKVNIINKIAVKQKHNYNKKNYLNS